MVYKDLFPVMQAVFASGVTLLAGLQYHSVDGYRPLLPVEERAASPKAVTLADLYGFVRKVVVVRIAAMPGWRHAWQGVTNSLMHHGS